MSLRGLDGEWWEHVAPEHEQYVGDQRADDFAQIDREAEDVLVAAGISRPSRRNGGTALPHRTMSALAAPQRSSAASRPGGHQHVPDAA